MVSKAKHEKVTELLREVWHWITKKAPFQAPEVYAENRAYYDSRIREVLMEEELGK